MKKQSLGKGLAFAMLGLMSHSVYAQKSSSHQLFRGAIVDAGNQFVYTIKPSGGINAIEIATGKEVWQSFSADLPLMVHDSKLVAQKNSTSAGKLELISFDSRSGAVADSRSVAVPKGVYAQVGDGINHRFNIKAGAESSKLQWQYNNEAIRGAAKPELFEVASQGKSISAKSKRMYGEVSMNNSLRSASSRALTGHTAAKASIEGRFLENVKGRQFKSLSGQYILASTRKSNVTLWNKYVWNVYDLSGNLIGSMDNSSSYSAFDVVDGVMMYVSKPYTRMINKVEQKTPLMVNAVSLKTGEKIWSHEIRDLTYTGPIPQ